MPVREYGREQDWLLPPSLGELIAPDHPVRSVAEFVDGLDWAAVGILALALATTAQTGWLWVRSRTFADAATR